MFSIFKVISLSENLGGDCGAEPPPVIGDMGAEPHCLE